MNTKQEDFDLPDVEAVKTRADLVKFLEQLADLFPNDRFWENDTVPSYLRGAAGYVHDVDGAYLNRGETFDENQNYKLIARIFLAATAYE